VRPTDYQLDASGLEHAEFATANVFVKRRALAAIGGFDQRFTAAWREDSDLQFGLLEAGYTIVAAPQAQVCHPVRPARWGVSLSQQKKSQFDALLSKKHAQLCSTRIRPGTPWLYYGVYLAVVAMALGWTAGRAPLAWCGLCAWLLLAGSFCARRLHRTSRSASHVAEMIWTSLWIPFLSVYWRLYGAIKFRAWFL
jgi:GT2 family glycosyltransferase